MDRAAIMTTLTSQAVEAVALEERLRALHTRLLAGEPVTLNTVMELLVAVRIEVHEREELIMIMAASLWDLDG